MNQQQEQDPTINAATGKPCKGKMAARALAVLVLCEATRAVLAQTDPKALEQAEEALRPFGWPNREALAAKLEVR